MGISNVRNLAINGKNGLPHAEQTIEVCRQSQCDIVRLQETRRDGQDGCKAAAFTVYYSGAGGGSTEPKGEHGVGIAIKRSVL